MNGLSNSANLKASCCILLTAGCLICGCAAFDSPEQKALGARSTTDQSEVARHAWRAAFYEKTVKHDLAAIRRCYELGGGFRRYKNPFLMPNRNGDTSNSEDWLSKWVFPRLGMPEQMALKGEAILSEFGMKYLPCAYANYEKNRIAARELQQIFNEEFPEPWRINEKDFKWNSFNKFLEKFVKIRTEYFICHDELCHYWLLWRFNALTDEDLRSVDSKRLAVCLLPENIERRGFARVKIEPMKRKIMDFALKYAPESIATYQKMEREFKMHDALLHEVFSQYFCMDGFARYSRVMEAAYAKRNDIAREMNSLSLLLQSWYMEHRIAEKSFDDVAKCDAETGKRLKTFLDSLQSYIKYRALGPIIPDAELAVIPMCRYRMQRTEVTEFQWMIVMGDKPSKMRGPDFPVENVSVEDCLKFVKRVSEMDGRTYRLPTNKEWEYVCRAGSTGDWGMRVNGQCGSLESMGWYVSNTHYNSMPVALKEPNAWGLFDMHGNVREWCGSRFDGYRGRGGCFNDSVRECSASNPGYYTAGKHSATGFRLVVLDN